MKRPENRWNLLKKYWWLLFDIAGLLILIYLLVRGFDWSHWAEPGPRAITLWGRPLWDWVGLLLVPLVLAIGGFLFQESQRKADRELAKEARMDKTLDEYLKAMTSFLLQENSLLKSNEDEPIRNVARTQTISVIKRLDSERNQIVFQFLQEANLISTMKEDETEEVEKPILSLAWADLSDTYLNKVDLSEADLSEADLQGAKLNFAELHGAKFFKANLRGADLQFADLSEADLSGANLTEADLTGAYLDGSDLQWAKLHRANLYGAKLRRANLTGANLIEAYLRKANLIETYLPRVKLQGADLQGTLFSDISSMVEEGYFEGTTMPDGTIFSESTDLKKFIDPPKEELSEQILQFLKEVFGIEK